MRIGKLPLLVVPLLLIATLLFINHTQPAAATQSEYEASWAIHVDFVGNQPNATLTVRVKETIGGMVQPELISQHTMPCHVPAAVSINNDEAIFNGKGGILCGIPSMKQIVFEMTDGEFILPDECDCKSGAFATSSLVLDPNSSGELRRNPVFTMKDLGMEAQMLPSSTLSSQMRFVVDGRSALSDTFFANLSANFLLANFHQINGPQATDLAFTPLFDANGFDLQSTPELIEDDLALSFKQHRIYIGYSPLIHQGMHGRIRTLDIDPGCFGTGG